MTIAGLDRYLTQEPPDDFTPWCEWCANFIECTDQQWIDYEKQMDKFMDRLYDKGHTPEYAAKIISRWVKSQK